MKKGLIAAGVLVVGALVFFWIRSSPSSSAPQTKVSANGDVLENGVRRAPSPKRMSGAAGDTPNPKRYSGDGTDTASTTRNYTRDDGTVVRDHRSGAQEPNLDRRPTLPKELSKVQPETLRAVRLALRPAMKKCIAEHVANAPENSKAQAVLTVSIKDELLHVDKLDFQTEGLVADSEASLGDCASTAMLGHEQPIAGSPDVDKHVMTFPYNL